MLLNKIRQQVLNQYAISSLLKLGLPITEKNICSIIDNEFNTQSGSLCLTNTSLMVNPGEIISATKLNKTIQYINLDLKIIDEYLNQLITKLEQYSNNSFSKLKTIENMLNELNSIISVLQATVQITNKLNETKQVYIDVSDIQYINLEQTTASIDFINKTASLPNSQDFESIQSNNNIDSIEIKSQMPNSGITQNIPLITFINNKLSSPWECQIFSAQQSKNYFDISIEITFKTPTDINTINAVFGDNNIYGVEATGITENDLTVLLSEIKSYTNEALIYFDKTTLKKLILTIRIFTYNSNKYKLTLNKLFINANNYTKTATLVTNEISVENGFSALIISSNEILPPNTDIQFYISTFSNQWSDFTKIEPYNRTNTFDSIYNVFNNYTPNNIIATLDFTKIHSYIWGDLVTLNYPIQSNAINNYKITKILRNLNNFIFNENSNFVHIILYLAQPTTIDFSEIPGYIEQEYFNTKKQLTPGFYNFRFTQIDKVLEYIEYLRYLSTSQQSFYFGSHISTYININDFITLDDNIKQKYFTVIKIDNNYYYLIKANTPNLFETTKQETALIIEYNQEIQKPTKIKLKCLLIGDGSVSPKLKGFKIIFGEGL